MKLYISGGITNVPDYKERFTTAECALVASGYEVENPASYEFDERTPWEIAMKYDLARLLECDGVALLDNWQLSRGACCEVDIASVLHIPVQNIATWIEEKRT